MIKQFKKFMITVATIDHFDLIPYIGIWKKRAGSFRYGFIVGWINGMIGIHRYNLSENTPWTDPSIYIMKNNFLFMRDQYIIYTPTISISRKYIFIQIFGFYVVFGDYSDFI